MKRIRRLLYPKGVNGAWTPLLTALIFLTTAVVAFAAWPPEPPQQSSAIPERHARPAETSSYDRWLNQEVVYIITKEERAAFQKLTDDEERNHFIEQFWERRNPNPGSPENKFKEEYYRRIAYANEHWASDRRPGWKTDRGHMYIIYGPPDEIDAHPSGPPHPFEEWRYKFIKGLGNNATFTFVDWAGNGEYRLAPGRPVKKN